MNTKQHTIFSVSQITNQVKHTLEKQYNNIWIKGEVSSCKTYPSGHTYLVLKDENSEISCVMFAEYSLNIKDEFMIGIEVVVYGDLSLPETLPPALKGINVVIDAATVRPSDDFNAKKIDWMGKVALIEASKLAEIKKFIFFSVLGAGTNAEIPLLDLKLQTEQLLKKSGIDFTVFQCSGFFQGLINQYAIPVLENQTVWLLGDSASIPYIDTQDAAGVVVESLKQEQTSNTTYALIGKKAWSSNEIVEVCQRLAGESAKISYVPFFALQFLKQFFRCFEFTWNIADRLQFAEISVSPQDMTNSNNASKQNSDLLTLEQYFQEYFGKILRKLKESNYQQTQKAKDISF